MVVLPLLQLVAPADVGVHRAALDRAGADQRDLDDQVVELPRLQPGQGGHLRAGLHLEHPDRVGPLQHRVDRGVGRLQLVQLDLPPVVLGDQVDHQVQRGEHAQPEQVELDQPGGRAVVLVPLHHAAAGHPRPLHRHHLGHRPVADDHAAGVDAQVPGEAEQLVGQGHHLLRHAVRRAARRPGPDQRSIRLLQASCWPGENPSALAMSRTADRGR